MHKTTEIKETPESILEQFLVELDQLKKERQGIVDRYLEALRQRKIQVIQSRLQS